MNAVPPIPAPVCDLTQQPVEGLLRKKDLAQQLNVKLRTVEEWQAAGILPYIKVRKMVLFYWPDVIEHLRSNYQVRGKRLRVDRREGLGTDLTKQK